LINKNLIETDVIIELFLVKKMSYFPFPLTLFSQIMRGVHDH